MWSEALDDMTERQMDAREIDLRDDGFSDEALEAYFRWAYAEALCAKRASLAQLR